MTQTANHDSGPEPSGPFPEWCKDAADKMAGCGLMMEKMMAHCGPMMEKMMARFGAKPTERPCDRGETRE